MVKTFEEIMKSLHSVDISINFFSELMQTRRKWNRFIMLKKLKFNIQQKIFFRNKCDTETFSEKTKERIKG